MDTLLPLTNTTTIIRDIITKLKEFSFSILDLINTFIINESYPFLDKYPVIKYALIFIIIVIIILCFLLILFNSYTGISQVFNDMFDIDSYRYIDTFDIDLDNNFKKLYLPEFILSGFGIGILISILLYIRSQEKKNIATENANKDQQPEISAIETENANKDQQPEISAIETKNANKDQQPDLETEISDIKTKKLEQSDLETEKPDIETEKLEQPNLETEKPKKIKIPEILETPETPEKLGIYEQSEQSKQSTTPKPIKRPKILEKT
jgi:hypothetical protein